MHTKFASLLGKFSLMILAVIFTTQCVAAPSASETRTTSNAAGASSTVSPQETGSPTEIIAVSNDQPGVIDLKDIPSLGTTRFKVDTATTV
jgi:hypothetical protein